MDKQVGRGCSMANVRHVRLTLCLLLDQLKNSPLWLRHLDRLHTFATMYVVGAAQ